MQFDLAGRGAVGTFGGSRLEQFRVGLSEAAEEQAAGEYKGDFQGAHARPLECFLMGIQNHIRTPSTSRASLRFSPSSRA